METYTRLTLLETVTMHYAHWAVNDTWTLQIMSEQFGHPELFYECLPGNYSAMFRLSDKRLALNDLINIIIDMDFKNITAIKKKVHSLYIWYSCSLGKC